MKQLLHLILLFFGFFVFSQGTQCDIADPFCSSDAFTFPNNYSGNNAESGPDYGCLESVPNPAWYFLYIDNSGTLSFSISQVSNSGQGIDVDFICYGPFSDPYAACQANLTSQSIVACSYSPNTTENFTISNAISGEYYIVLITNYSGEEGNITFQQTNVNQANAGSTDCSIVCTVDLPNDTSVCLNTNYTITTILGNQNMEDTASYYWYQDGVLLADTTPYLQVSSAVVGSHTYRVEVDAQFCDALATDEITINFVDPTIGLQLTNLPSLYSCESNVTGIAVFDLTQNNSIIANANNVNDYLFNFYKDSALTEVIQNPMNYETSNLNETIYAEVIHATYGCPVVTSFQINKIRSPYFDIEDPILYKCKNDNNDFRTFKVINAEDVYLYQWKDINNNVVSTSDMLTTNITGDYTVTATTADGYNCTTTKAVQLIGVEAATIVEVKILEYYIEDNFSAEVLIEGNGFYEFAINNSNGPYQEESVFINLKPGIYTIYVREKNGCGISSKEIIVFGFPKFFTPNDDNINDIWKVENLFFNSEAKITIFDRYGRVLTVFYPAKNQGWNGIFKGKQMPPTDYWFTAEITNRFGKNVIRHGHFALIR